MGNEEDEREMDGTDADDIEETLLDDEIEEEAEMADLSFSNGSEKESEGEEEEVKSEGEDLGIPTEPVDDGATGEAELPVDAEDDIALLNDEEPQAEAVNEEVAKYKFLGEVSRPDGTGTMQNLPAGSIVELPVIVGDSYVEDGSAERVVE